jgi:hypothetical protein
MTERLFYKFESPIEDGAISINGLFRCVVAGNSGEVRVPQLQGYASGVLALLA